MASGLCLAGRLAGAHVFFGRGAIDPGGPPESRRRPPVWIRGPCRTFLVLIFAPLTSKTDEGAHQILILLILPHPNLAKGMVEISSAPSMAGAPKIVIDFESRSPSLRAYGRAIRVFSLKEKRVKRSGHYDRGREESGRVQGTINVFRSRIAPAARRRP
jgi:hypothetical protein